MARVVYGLILGVLLVFPGVELVRFLAARLFGAYDDMTLTEACLAMIIILLSVILVRGASWGHPAATRGETITVRPARRRASAPRPRRRSSEETAEPRPRRRALEDTPPAPRPRRAPARSSRPAEPPRRPSDSPAPRSPRRPR